MDINQEHKNYWLSHQCEHKLFIQYFKEIKGAVTMAKVVQVAYMLTKDTSYPYLTISK